MSLTTSEIKKLLKKWHFYKAITLNLPEEELGRKIRAIENALNYLEDIDQEIIRLKYFLLVDIDIIQSKVGISRSGVYYRLDKGLQELLYIIKNI